MQAVTSQSGTSFAAEDINAQKRTDDQTPTPVYHLLNLYADMSTMSHSGCDCVVMAACKLEIILYIYIYYNTIADPLPAMAINLKQKVCSRGIDTVAHWYAYGIMLLYQSC